MNSFLVSAAVTAETAIVVAAAFVVVRQRAGSAAAAYAVAVVFALCGLSLLYQSLFALGIHDYSLAADAFMLAACGTLVYRNRAVVTGAFGELWGFVRGNRVFAGVLFGSMAAIFVIGFALPPTVYDSLTYHLARILMMQNEGAYFLTNFSDYRQDIYPIGYDILYFPYLRFYSDFGLSVPGFLSYTVLLAAAYDLCQRLFRNPALSRVITLVAAALPVFVLHASVAKNDLILAALALVLLLSSLEILSRRDPFYLVVGVTTAIFGVTAKLSFAFFAALMGLAVLWALWRQHGAGQIGRMLASAARLGRGLPLLFPIGSAGFLAGLFVHNWRAYGSASGPGAYVAFATQDPGLKDFFINGARYLIQLLAIPQEIFGSAVSLWFAKQLGKDALTGVQDQITAYLPTLEASFTPPPEAAWYGPLGLVLVFALLYTAWRGRGALRLGALVALAFALIAAMAVPWTPWRGRYFGPSMAVALICLGFACAAVNEKWPRQGKVLSGFLVAVSAANLLFLAFARPVLNFDKWTRLAGDRNAAYIGLSGLRNAWLPLVRDTAPGSRVLLISNVDTALYPFYMQRPDLAFTNTGIRGREYYGGLNIGGRRHDILGQDIFALIEAEFDAAFILNAPAEFITEFMALKRRGETGNAGGAADQR